MKRLMFLPILIFVTGCSQKIVPIQDNQKDFNIEKIKYNYQMQQKQELSDGSISMDNIDNLMEEHTNNIKVGDTIVIKIEEQVSTQTRNNNITNKSSSNSVTAGGVTTANVKLQAFLDATVNPYASIGLNNSSKKGFIGKVNNSVNDSMAASITALVTEKISKYLYKIEAKKTIKLNNNEKRMLLMGYIHTSNIEEGNKISSKKIINLNINYLTEGSNTDTLQKGYVQKFLDKMF